MAVKIRDSVVLVTGANRGLGLEITQALLQAGARKVYAAARDPRQITMQGVVPVRLDVTRDEDILAAARTCGDVSILVNNAGVACRTSFLAPETLQAARTEMDVNYFGPLALSRSFAPILARQGGGAIVNILSVLSWLNVPDFATYSASKAAAWSLSNGLRGELRPQGTQVLGVHVGYMDTAMVHDICAPKLSPRIVADQVLTALEEGCEELLADEISREVKRGLSAGSP